MTDEAKNEINEEGRPVTLVQDVQVKEVLGHITVGDAAIIKGGVPNSTRWVFDVTCTKATKIKVQLVNHFDGRDFDTDIEPSFHFTGMSKDFHEAHVWGKTRGSMLAIDIGGACTFRVDMDAIGSNRR